MRHLALPMLAATAILSATPASAASALGDWNTQGGMSKVRIAPCAGASAKMCGTIVWLKDPLTSLGKPKTDSENPNIKLRSRSIVGLQFLSGFSSAGTGKWAGGTIYDPQSGKTYKSKMSLNPNGSLKVEGCVLFICRGQTWTRAR